MRNDSGQATLRPFPDRIECGRHHQHGLGYWHWIKWEKKKTSKSYAYISLFFLVCEIWASILLLHHPGIGCSYHYVFPNWELKLGGIFNLPSLNSVLQGSLSQPWEMLLMQAVSETDISQSLCLGGKDSDYSLITRESSFPSSPGPISDFLHILIVKFQISHLLLCTHLLLSFGKTTLSRMKALVVDCCQYLFTFVFIPKLCN